MFSVRRFTYSGCPFDIFTLFLYIVQHVFFLDMYQLFTTGRQVKKNNNQSINQANKMVVRQHVTLVTDDKIMTFEIQVLTKCGEG